MASSPTLIDWAQDSRNDDLYAEAMRELESFRKNFASESFFIAIKGTREYYYNNSSGEYTGNELQYILRENRPADQWFFSLIEQNRDLHININPDVELGVTKLWIDVLMRDSKGEVLAVLGTGILLEEVIEDLLAPSQDGVASMFVDHDGAIQLYQDSRIIDFSSFVKPVGQKRTLDLVVDHPEEGQELIDILKSLQKNPELQQGIATKYVLVAGERHLVGISYLPSIGWFDVTFLNLSKILPSDRFWLLGIIFLTFLSLILVIVHFAIRREITGPISTLAFQMRNFSHGEMRPDTLDNVHKGELGEIFGQFKKMATLVSDNTSRLEAMVEERTKKLEAMANEDNLTGLLNRNAMTKVLAKEADRCKRLGLSFGIIWIDIDNFKAVNDSYGHASGDTLLVELATELKKDLRTYDYAARWGGDEFIVLLSPTDEVQLSLVGKRIRLSICANHMFEEYSTKVSTGWALSESEKSYEDVLAIADRALYQSKKARVSNS